MTPSNWVVYGPRPCLIGPFPTRAAAVAWGGEWQTRGRTRVCHFAQLPLGKLGIPADLKPEQLVSPAHVAKVTLQAMRLKERPWE